MQLVWLAHRDARMTDVPLLDRKESVLTAKLTTTLSFHQMIQELEKGTWLSNMTWIINGTCWETSVMAPVHLCVLTYHCNSNMAISFHLEIHTWQYNSFKRWMISLVNKDREKKYSLSLLMGPKQIRYLNLGQISQSRSAVCHLAILGLKIISWVGYSAQFHMKMANGFFVTATDQTWAPMAPGCSSTSSFLYTIRWFLRRDRPCSAHT